MVIGQHQAVRREDDTRAAAALALDVHHGRADGINRLNDGARICVEQLIVVDSRFGVHGRILETDVRTRITQTGYLGAGVRRPMELSCAT